MAELTKHRRSPSKLLIVGCLLLVFSLIYANWPWSREVLIPVKNAAGKYGYLNGNGKLVMPFQWFRATEFNQNGLAVVHVGDEKQKQWQAIDRNGKVVLTGPWTKGGSFSQSGVAITMLNNKWGLINEQGKVVVPHEWMFIEQLLTKTGFDYVDEMGWAQVTQGERNDYENYKTGWVDQQGKVVIPVEYDYGHLEAFDDYGWANAKKGKQSGWIDRKGTWVMPPEWDGCSSFDEHGWAVVYKDKKSGYVDRQGKIVLPLKWDHCWKFHPSGFAQVGIKEKRGLINRDGNVVIPVEWEICWMEDNGLIRVKKDGKEGLITLNGQVIVPIEYYKLSRSYGTEFWEANKGWITSSMKGLFNDKGQCVLDFQWDDIDAVEDRTAGKLYYCCERDAVFPFPDWVQDWLIKLYAKFDKAWTPSKICHVYDSKLNLIWRSNDWKNHLEYYTGVLGVVCILLGLWRQWRSSKPGHKAQSGSVQAHSGDSRLPTQLHPVQEPEDVSRRSGANYAASYAFLSQPTSSLSICSIASTLTRWVTMELKLPEASSRLVVGSPLRLMPTSSRVAVDGCTMANCLLRRRLTYVFLAETSTSLPNAVTACRSLS